MKLKSIENILIVLYCDQNVIIKNLIIYSHFAIAIHPLQL
jgi:hypothetical protein